MLVAAVGLKTYVEPVTLGFPPLTSKPLPLGIAYKPGSPFWGPDSLGKLLLPPDSIIVSIWTFNESPNQSLIG